MKIEDMILVSIDDHVIEPADLFENHMPEKYRDQGPHFERLSNGVDQWVFQGEVMGTVGLGATASWPRDEWNFDPVGLAEMRPGCYDIHQRVRDMNANGILASLNFGTAVGFAGAWLAGKPDLQLSAIAVSAYNDWQIDELAGSYPGRVIPLCILPLWDTDACVLELERIAAKGCRAITFPETPYANDLPSFYGDHWDAVLEACERLGIVLSMHIGGAFNLLTRPEGATADQLIVLAAQLSGVACTDLITSGTFRKFPNLKVALSEGGIGWVPFLLDRMDKHMWNQSWTGLDIGAATRHRDLAEELPRMLHHRAHQPAHHRPHRRAHGGVGVRLPALRLDLAEVARDADGRVRRRGHQRRRDPQDHLGERLHVLRLGSVPAHRRRSRPPSGRCGRSPTMSTPRSRPRPSTASGTSRRPATEPVTEPLTERVTHPLVEAARDLDPLIRKYADEAEQLGTTPLAVVDAAARGAAAALDGAARGRR